MSDLAQRFLTAAMTDAVEAEDEIAAGVLDAALRQFELFGIAKTTMDEVGRRARVARVTVYRRFPSKEALVEAVIMRELRRFHRQLTEATAPFLDPEQQLVEGFAFTVKAVSDHKLLQRLLESEADQLLPHFTTSGAPLLEVGRAFLAARMAEQLDDGRSFEEMLVAADVASRLVISYAITSGGPVSFADLDDARAFARTYLVAILRADLAG
ncbi:MAG TPA: TetR family transcriptional regulator [Baekduia sp.]|nr:TetR family transcriptional regulator [Baekduia sp.]